ncbi:serine/threonine protein kinase [bacterium]|jgi:serine/threonine-protein kinase|nr:serine/threonine protein kinase [bacterium]
MTSDDDKTLLSAAASDEVDTVVSPEAQSNNVRNFSDAAAARSGLQASRAMTRTEKFDRGDSAAISLRSVRLISSLADLSLIAAGLLSLCVIVGWVFSIDVLKRLFFDQLTGFPTAFWLCLLTVVTLPVVMKINASNKVVQVVSRAGLVLCVAVGAALWLEHLLGQDWNLAMPIYQPADAGYLTLPGLLSVDTSFCLMLVALTVLALEFVGASRPMVHQALSLLLGLPSLILVLAFMFGASGAVDGFCAMQGCVVFKYLTYLIFCLLEVSIFLSRPTLGITRLLAIDTVGGKFFRLSILAFIGMVPVSWALQQAVAREIVNLPSALLLAFIALAAEVSAIFAYSARKIDKIGFEKQETEDSLAELSSSQEEGLKYKMVCLSCAKEFPEGWLSCPYDGADLSRIADRFAPGSLFAGKYEVGDRLGSGGMSTVYLAKHKFLNKNVAVKVLHSNLASDAKSVQRFQMEAKAAFDLTHPNLLTIYDFGISQDGQAYIVMDYIEGESLSDLVQRQGPITLTQALPLFYDICLGLAHAHEKNVLHRDIKPSNVMLLKGETRIVAKIVDFGLAKSYDESAMKLTQTGEIFGSPLYMSPEQCQGAALDNRSDIYSLGCLFYESLSGIPPIKGDSAYDTFKRKFSDSPQPFDPALNIPGWLSALIMSMLSVKRDERPASAQAVAKSFAAFVR